MNPSDIIDCFCLDYPVETIKEGKVEIIVPKLELFGKKHWDYSPTKAPVFYNPIMELNRDLAVLALRVYQKLKAKRLRICEPMTGSGIRGIRFAKEVEGIHSVILNDINLRAFKLTLLNTRKHNLSKIISVRNESANLLLNRFTSHKKSFDFIDLDPFGSPSPYIDSAVSALKKGGLLALTATDLAPLTGVNPLSCIRKYGGKPLRTEYSRELAIRLLIGCLATQAARQNTGIQSILSYNSNHYIRAYALLNPGANLGNKSIQNMGHVLHCSKCLHRQFIRGDLLYTSNECLECNSELKAAGPLWLGKLSNASFCRLVQIEAGISDLKNKFRLVKLLSLIQNETEAPETYYVTDYFCDKLNLPTPPLERVIINLREKGFEATPTHFNSRGIKTNASAKDIARIINQIVN